MTVSPPFLIFFSNYCSMVQTTPWGFFVLFCFFPLKYPDMWKMVSDIKEKNIEKGWWMLISNPKRRNKCKALSPFHTTKYPEIKPLMDPMLPLKEGSERFVWTHLKVEFISWSSWKKEIVANDIFSAPPAFGWGDIDAPSHGAWGSRTTRSDFQVSHSSEMFFCLRLDEIN